MLVCPKSMTGTFSNPDASERRIVDQHIEIACIGVALAVVDLTLPRAGQERAGLETRDVLGQLGQGLQAIEP
jgi:hypothetical protein